MKELIFSIRDIFDCQSTSGCLTQYGVNKYHIPAYQRGYKWSSEPNGAVSILLKDLQDAFEVNKGQKEYYLQYITVKKATVEVKGQKEDCLEVIDGQQRLTTLSVLLSVLSNHLNKENISNGRLHYAIRDNFFDKRIYVPDELNTLIQTDWAELAANEESNKQDIFYLHGASRAIKIFIDKLGATSEDFHDFVLQKVKLIVNSVEAHINSEEVFKNLNSNKVPLTEVELIKALLITRLGRTKVKSNLRFKEIVEVRTNLGRKWDEMGLWANQPEICSFFFNREDGLHQLLLLTALRLGAKIGEIHKIKEQKDFPLFNFFHSIQDSAESFNILWETYSIMNDWFTSRDHKIYNLIGFCRFAGNSKKDSFKFLQPLFEKNKKELEEYLMTEKSKLIPSDVTELRYGENNSEIHAALLALSVFVEGQTLRFDFHKFVEEAWSLEHIFPQTPEGKGITLSDSDKKEIKEILQLENENPLMAKLNLPVRNESEKTELSTALQQIPQLNQIGNLCLLSSSDNSSNGCKLFKDKRNNILERSRLGSFVPKHTFDVFSKMVIQRNENLSEWSFIDIEEHNNYIQTTLNPQYSK